ncbi:MAG: nucleotidyltransferase family protein [Elusimicrobia bacterium]|nr:nucleotidyltransferase family protein [Elusimicrobiota bacterium]
MTGARVLLLAAGRGRRAGGPKAWLPYEGKTLLEAQLGFLSGLVGEGGLSVAIQPEWRARAAALSPRVLWVGADPDAPPLDTLRRLVAASPPARSFVLHVDMPVFDRAVWEALWASHAPAAVPDFGGRRGHPVLLSCAALADVARLDPAKDRLDAFLRARGAAAVPVAADSVLLNLNEGAE